MGKGKSKGREANRHNKDSGRPVKEMSMSDYLAAAPGLLMCFMVVMMLVLDVAVAGMLDRQYPEFQRMFRVLNIAAAAAVLPLIVYRCRFYAKSGPDLKAYKNRRHRAAVFALWGLFALWILISTAVNGLTSEALHGLPYRNIGAFHSISFIIIYLWASSDIRRDSLRRDIVIAYITAADALALAVLYDIFTGGIAAFHEKKEISGIFFNGNHYGYFLMMAVLLGIGLWLFGNMRQAVFGAASSALNAVLLAVNHSMGSIIAVAGAVALTALYILIWDRSRARRMAILLAASAALVLAAMALIPDLQKEFVKFAADVGDILSNNAKGSTGHNRIKVWRRTAEYISARPFFGYGCEGMSMDLYAEYAISNPHNELLTYAAYYGIPAAGLYTAAVLTTLAERVRRTSDRDVWSAVACMAAAGYFISSVTGVSMFYTTPFFYVFMGISMTVAINNH